MTLVADVAGTTLANDAYWADKCKIIPPTALFIVVQMGDVTDFFKPVNSETSICEMLLSYENYRWSHNGVDWVNVVRYEGDINMGGSESWWPRDRGIEGDERQYLSFWGYAPATHSGGCCSTTTKVARTDNSNGAIPFTLSCVVQLQPLPPNTGMSLVADVPGTTFANDAFWAEQSKIIPSNALFVVVDMGAVRDFFKPVDGVTTYCEMLQAHNKHQWSANGVDWFVINYYSDGFNGGSVDWWPRDQGHAGDERRYLSFWGSESHQGTGSSTSYVVNYTGWGNRFTLSYATPLHPLPPNTGMSIVADVPGTTLANDAFWAERCKTIPSNALFVVVDMGAVRDFFKPIDSRTSFCEMLQSSVKQQWSPNGVKWYKVGAVLDDSHNGGSDVDWPRDQGLEQDQRRHVSFWGHEWMRGGCCSTSTAVYSTAVYLEKENGWNHPFSMSYGYSFDYVKAYARLLAENQQLNNTIATLSDNLTIEQHNLATEHGKIAALSNDLVSEKSNVAALSQNLATCNIKLEQRRLARLAQAEEDLANDQATSGGTNSDTDDNSTPSPNGTVAGGVVAGLVVIGIIVFILHRKAGSNGVQRNQRNNEEAEELRDRGATLEMVQNPMREQQRAAVDVYYSEIAEAPNQDADGYVVDDSLAEPETPVYATYASSGAPDAVFYTAPADGDGFATYTAPLDANAASASLPEDGGVAYSRSANSVVAPGSNTSHA